MHARGSVADETRHDYRHYTPSSPLTTQTPIHTSLTHYPFVLSNNRRTPPPLHLTPHRGGDSNHEHCLADVPLGTFLTVSWKGWCAPYPHLHEDAIRVSDHPSVAGTMTVMPGIFSC